MTTQEARELLGSRPRWELLNMKKALEIFGGFFNDEKDDRRLEAVKILLANTKQ